MEYELRLFYLINSGRSQRRWRNHGLFYFLVTSAKGSKLLKIEFLKDHHIQGGRNDKRACKPSQRNSKSKRRLSRPLFFARTRRRQKPSATRR